MKLILEKPEKNVTERFQFYWFHPKTDKTVPAGDEKINLTTKGSIKKAKKEEKQNKNR